MKRQVATTILQGEELANRAGLRYVTDEEAGYSRLQNGSGFKYLNCRGKVLRNARQLQRIEGLVIPPAWQKVWICRLPNGHLQVTGYDKRKRKQYLYHERWQEAANLEKFDRLGEFGQTLPGLRRKVQARLKGNQLVSERVLAGMLAILDATAIRIGNEEYVKSNKSYGLATLRTRHLSFEKGAAILTFNGKSGVQHELIVKPKQCVRLLRQLHKLSGARVFQFIDADGTQRDATAQDVNEFLNELTGQPFTAKDFRTWTSSALVIGLLDRDKDIEKIAERKKIARAAVKQAAELLRNTQATSRKHYIHPRLLESYEEGDFPKLLSRFKYNRSKGLSRDEQLLAHFLTRCSNC